MYDECFPELADEIRAALEGRYVYYELSDAFPHSGEGDSLR
jgi:hypothetical protein